MIDTNVVIAIFLPLSMVTIVIAIMYIVYVSSVTSSSKDNNNSLPRDRVVFFSKCGYRGHQVNHADKSELKDNHEIGIGKGSLKSVWVPQGFKVTLFSEDKFNGDRKVLNRSVECLDESWTSARIEKLPEELDPPPKTPFVFNIEHVRKFLSVIQPPIPESQVERVSKDYVDVLNQFLDHARRLQLSETVQSNTICDFFPQCLRFSIPAADYLENVQKWQSYARSLPKDGCRLLSSYLQDVEMAGEPAGHNKQIFMEVVRFCNII
jgi:hypothetical protein